MQRPTIFRIFFFKDLKKIKILFLAFVSISAQEKLQSPLQVLMCLAVDNGPNLSSVRDYFLQVFQKDIEAAKSVRMKIVQKFDAKTIFYAANSIELTSHVISGRRIGCQVSQ